MDKEEVVYKIHSYLELCRTSCIATPIFPVEPINPIFIMILCILLAK